MKSKDKRRSSSIPRVELACDILFLFIASFISTMLSNVLLFYHAHRNAYKLFVLIIMILSLYCFLKTKQTAFYEANKEGSI